MTYIVGYFYGRDPYDHSKEVCEDFRVFPHEPEALTYFESLKKSDYSRLRGHGFAWMHTFFIKKGDPTHVLTHVCFDPPEEQRLELNVAAKKKKKAMSMDDPFSIPAASSPMLWTFLQSPQEEEAAS